MNKLLYKTSLALSICLIAVCTACAQKSATETQAKEAAAKVKQNTGTPATATHLPKTTKKMEWNKLTKEEEDVIVRKGTEFPGTGKYDNFYEKGTYHCKRCDAALYSSDSKFDGHCGWPAFDDEIKGAVKRLPDADGQRTEIVCAHCGAHLGHVFEGEGFTAKDTRHCVNSISMVFVPAGKEKKS